MQVVQEAFGWREEKFSFDCIRIILDQLDWGPVGLGELLSSFNDAILSKNGVVEVRAGIQ